MAANMGVETFVSVFLLCCWQGAELQPINATSGPVTEDSLNSTTEEIPEVFDEIIAQELLEPNTTAVSETPPSTKVSTVKTTEKNKEKSKYSPFTPIMACIPRALRYAGIDENYQEDGSENYHELLENLELSPMNKEKADTNDKSTAENIHDNSSQTKLKPHFSFEEKKSASNDKYERVSVLDRILQNLGRSEGSLELTESIF
ncbi:Spaca7 [Phodopus roborovskii]|uniref:Spaca7 protein n=1 Tax=Phodopus roborovskii TaxID=109678 RepID=A0AAU9Z519_PHORO|nr:Spaca7 [Phodopus roborovskii]